MKQHTFALLAALFFTQAGITQSNGTFTDSRDGQTYKTISFKNNGTNSSGFNALAGGQRRPDVSRNVLVGSIGLWWTSTPTGEKGKAWEWNLHYGGTDQQLKSKVFRFDGDVSGGLSVRCVRD